MENDSGRELLCLNSSSWKRFLFAQTSALSAETKIGISPIISMPFSLA